MSGELRVVRVAHDPSPALREAMASLGVGLEFSRGAGRRGRPVGACAHRVANVASARGAIVLITGPSGGGKSTLLGRVERALRGRGEVVRRVVARRDGALHESGGPDPPSALDSMRGAGAGVAQAMAGLSRMGLGDASVMARDPRDLSEGEWARLALARAMAADVGGVVLADEFASVLDRPGARLLCWAVARAVRSGNWSLVAATAHDDVIAWLAPDAIVRCEGGRARIEVSSRRGAA